MLAIENVWNSCIKHCMCFVSLLGLVVAAAAACAVCAQGPLPVLSVASVGSDIEGSCRMASSLQSFCCTCSATPAPKTFSLCSPSCRQGTPRHTFWIIRVSSTCIDGVWAKCLKVTCCFAVMTLYGIELEGWSAVAHQKGRGVTSVDPGAVCVRGVRFATQAGLCGQGSQRQGVPPFLHRRRLRPQVCVVLSLVFP